MSQIIVPLLSHIPFILMMYCSSRLAKKWYKTLFLSGLLNIAIIFPFSLFVDNVYHYDIDRIIFLFYGLLLIYISIFFSCLNRQGKHLYDFTSAFFTLAAFVFGYLTIIAFPYYLSLQMDSQDNAILYNSLSLIRPFHFALNAMTSGQFEVEGTIAHKIILYYLSSGSFYYPIMIITIIVIILAPFSTAAWLVSMINTRLVLKIMEKMKKKCLYICEINEYGIYLARQLASDKEFTKIQFVFVNLTNEVVSNDVLDMIYQIGGIYLPDFQSIVPENNNSVFLFCSSEDKTVKRALDTSFLNRVDTNRIALAIDDYSADNIGLIKNYKFSESNIINACDVLINNYIDNLLPDTDEYIDCYILGEVLAVYDFLNIIVKKHFNKINIYLANPEHHKDLEYIDGSKLCVNKLPDRADYDDILLPTIDQDANKMIIIASNEQNTKDICISELGRYYKSGVIKNNDIVLIYQHSKNNYLINSQMNLNWSKEDGSIFENYFCFGSKEEFIATILEMGLKETITKMYDNKLSFSSL
ncbi:hypothetical protein SAMN04487833_1374 [Sarcina sp. DSM 11001]|uniref:hypothetical protein n=1 Tax=Sarcina sp. DSM 11001 TaxID=1798184 RepID=UPI00088477BE|nr:hypothetical protein [Sarcina sp. DSM 11001]SDL89205.1 hypothetical protein SAMN04487833_1374 [Sarcina sp. DSM 11001]